MELTEYQWERLEMMIENPSREGIDRITLTLNDYGEWDLVGEPTDEFQKVMGVVVHETIDENGETVGYPVWSPRDIIMEGSHIYKSPKRELNGKLKKQEQNRNKQEVNRRRAVKRIGGETEVNREK